MNNYSSELLASHASLNISFLIPSLCNYLGWSFYFFIIRISIQKKPDSDKKTGIPFRFNQSQVSVVPKKLFNISQMFVAFNSLAVSQLSIIPDFHTLNSLKLKMFSDIFTKVHNWNCYFNWNCWKFGEAGMLPTRMHPLSFGSWQNVNYGARSFTLFDDIKIINVWKFSMNVSSHDFPVLMHLNKWSKKSECNDYYAKLNDAYETFLFKLHSTASFT